MVDFIIRIASVFSTPVGAFLLAMAMLTIAGILIWAFWKNSGGETSATTAIDVDSPKVAPPLLAPDLFKGSANVAPSPDNTIRNLLLGVVGLMVVFVVWQFATMERVDAPRNADVPANTRTTDTTGLPQQEPVRRAQQIIDERDERFLCEETFLGLPEVTEEDLINQEKSTYINTSFVEPISYQLCEGPTRAAQFDLIQFSRGIDSSSTLLNPRWKHTASTMVEADNQPTAFKLDERVSMVPGTGMAIEDYDFFIAVGLAESGLESEELRQRSSARGFSIARYVLETLRNEQPITDCSSEAVVHAMSVGGFNEAAGDLDQTRPVLIGVKLMKGYDAENRHDQRLINAFMRSPGVAITGYNLRQFQPHQRLFTENACDTSADRALSIQAPRDL